MREITIDQKGIEYDRQWMITDNNYQFINQKQNPKIAAIKVRFDQAVLLKAASMTPLSFFMQTGGQSRRQAALRKLTVEVFDEGDLVAVWLSNFLGQDVRLVRIAENFVRKVKHTTIQAETRLTDDAPLLVVSQTSLVDLNAYYQHVGLAPLPMDRFRPNVVITECQEPWVEDSWGCIQLGDLVFDYVAPCVRCQIILVDQATGIYAETDHLKAMRDYHAINHKPVFGAYFAHRQCGVIKIGDLLRVIAWKI